MLESEILDLEDFITNISKLKEDGKDKNISLDSDKSFSIPDLNTFDADINFKINQILFDKFRIGSLDLAGFVRNGKLEINPLTIEFPDGDANFIFEGENYNNQFILTAKGSLKEYDYGLLAKVIDPKTEAQGILNFRVDLETFGRSIEELDDNLKGELKLNIKPEQMDADLINLWAFSLINNLTPKWILKNQEKPKINCLNGNLKFDRGVVRPDDLNLDTTNVRVKIVGNVNIMNSNLNLVFKPIPKKPQLFGLGIPIRVIGNIQDYHIVTDPYNIGWYVLRLGYSGMEYVLNFLAKNSYQLMGMIYAIKKLH